MKKKVNYKLILLMVSVVMIIGVFVFYCFEKEKKQVLEAYFPDTKFTNFTEYVIRDGDTILHGDFKRYNENNIKIAEGKFVNGDIFGKCSYFYSNGKIEEIHFRKTSEITLESSFFSKLGFIKRYVIYNSEGKPFFYVDFNKNKVTKLDGEPIWGKEHFLQNSNKNIPIKDGVIVKVGDTLKYSYIVANIPNAKRSFTIENVGIDNTKVKRILKNVPPAQIDVKEVLTKKGKNTIRSIVRYEFNDKVSPVFTDTLSFDVEVN